MPAPGRLKSLTLTAFRGSTTTFKLDFEKSKKLTLIYGENGTGKTTICDAFEFLSREKVGSLENRGMGKGLEKFWPTAGKPVTALAVDLETSAVKCSGRIVGAKVSISPIAARPRIELLRQRQILELIQAQPAARYDAIKRFIDISDFEASEEALRQFIKSLTDKREDAQQAEDQSLLELQGFYEAAGESADINAVIWAKQKLAEPSGNLDEDIIAIGKLRSAFDALKAFPERVETRQAAVTTAETALADAETALAAVAQAAINGAADILAVLEAGSHFLHAHPDATECPLCGSEENAANLANDVASRLVCLAGLRAATATHRQHTTALTAAKNALAQIDSDYGKAIAIYTAAKYSHDWKADVQLPTDVPPTDLPLLTDWLGTNEATAQTWPAVEASWREEKKFTAALKLASERYNSNLASRTELDVLLPKMEEALKICIEQRQEFINNVISEIAQEVGKLYEKVHPGEGLDTIALPLDPKKRASIELEANFSGHDVPPQAYFSQSHLDTLGLCVFLALATRDRADETVLILDDVLGSVDEPHVERVIGIIYEISAKFQHTIVTTHYRPWREKFRWGLLKPDQDCQFVELTSWSLSHGLMLSGSIPEIVRLKSLLHEAAPDVQSICSKAGVILEALLDFLTLKYGCAVPRRSHGTYTLGDLLPAINKQLLAALKVEILDHAAIDSPTVSVVHLKPILDDIANIVTARNVIGAHFNPSAFGLYPDDGIRFAKHVEQLADALICPEHGWPTKAKSGSYWQNSGDTRRLHPLRKPG